jgi:hypothetical protein
MVDIILSQQRVHNDVLASRLNLKAKRHLDDYMAEKHKRERKEEDLRLAEEQIAKLKEHLRQLEDIIDGTAKRPMPPREEGDSPEMHVNKRGRTDEVPLLALAQGNEGHISVPAIVTHVPIPAEPFPRREPANLNVPVLDSTRASVSVLDSLALTVLNDPVLNSPALNLPEESRRAPKTREEVWQRVHAGKAERIAKSTASSDSPRRSAPAPNAFAPAPSPSDNTGPISDTLGVNRYVPAPDKTRPAYREGYYTDEDLQTQSLEAWRIRLRAMHDYIPDRLWEKNVHLDRVKILQAALSHFKGEREKGDAKAFHGRSLAEYPHGRYESLQKQHYIPQEVCSPKELMGRLSQDDNLLYRFRCCPVSRYYSMLLEDTPGYVDSNFKPKSYDFRPKGNKIKGY